MNKSAPQADGLSQADQERFLAELSDLGRKYGLGIAEGALFILEREDFEFDYGCDCDSIINLGSRA